MQYKKDEDWLLDSKSVNLMEVLERTGRMETGGTLWFGWEDVPSQNEGREMYQSEWRGRNQRAGRAFSNHL